MYLHRYGGRFPEYPFWLRAKRLGGAESAAFAGRYGQLWGFKEKLPEHGGNFGLCHGYSAPRKIFGLSCRAYNQARKSGSGEKGAGTKCADKRSGAALQRLAEEGA